MQTQPIRSAPEAESGFTLFEFVIAAGILTVGIFGTAQLFIAASLLNSFAANTSQSLTDAQQTLEGFRVVASTARSQTAVDDVVRSSVVEPDPSAANPVRVATYVVDHEGHLVPSGTPLTLPPDLAALYGPDKTRAPSARSRLVIIRRTPERGDTKVNQVVTLVSTIEMKESY